ncbi:MAG: hypothetical protein ACWGQW_02070 [bacterium]
MKKATLNHRMRILQNMVDIQCTAGNWDYNPYMHGMANGLLMALATMKGEEVEYLDPPKKWRYKKSTREFLRRIFSLDPKKPPFERDIDG